MHGKSGKPYYIYIYKRNLHKTVVNIIKFNQTSKLAYKNHEYIIQQIKKFCIKDIWF